MTLDQLDILIQLKRGLFKNACQSDLQTLLNHKWIIKKDEEYQLTDRAEARLVLILSMPSGPPIDEIEVENHIKLITYEIKQKLEKRTKEFLKNGEVKVVIHARPEVMNELVTRYAKDGWEAVHEHGCIRLIWPKLPKNWKAIAHGNQ